jgi:hypothetical protein
MLMKWSVKCVEHLLPLAGNHGHEISGILAVGLNWEKGNATVGDARKAAVRAIALANASTDPVRTAIARAAGHAVATAHMADHSLGGAMYGLKAVNLSGNSVGQERKWQNEQLPQEIRELVLSGREEKERHFRI